MLTTELSDHPDLSVVMGVFNGSSRLAQTLDSVLTQTGCRIEFIVVDDGSTDVSPAILDAFAAKDRRLRVIHQPNAGLTRALIAGCALARGRFIARQDAGDLSLPGRLEKQLAALESNPELSFASCGTRHVEPQGHFLYQNQGSGFATKPSDIIDLSQRYGVRDGPSHHGSVMFRTDAYHRAGGYRAQFYFGQDWDLWYRLAHLGRFQMLHESLYQATVGVGDISTGNKHLQERLAQLSLEALKLRLDGRSDQSVLQQASLIRPEPGTHHARKRNSRGAYFLGECLRMNGNLVRAREYFFQSVKDDPFNVKAWVRLAQVPFSRSRGGPTV